MAAVPGSRAVPVAARRRLPVGQIAEDCPQLRDAGFHAVDSPLDGVEARHEVGRLLENNVFYRIEFVGAGTGHFTFAERSAICSRETSLSSVPGEQTLPRPFLSPGETADVGRGVGNQVALLVALV
jgi:hypothetical protein